MKRQPLRADTRRYMAIRYSRKGSDFLKHSADAQAFGSGAHMVRVNHLGGALVSFSHAFFRKSLRKGR